MNIGGINIVVNPGTEPIPDAYGPDAAKNMIVFLLDIDLDGVTLTRSPDEDTGDGVGDTGIGGGRFGYTLRRGDYSVVVQMPGFPLERTRFMKEPGQDPWHFPRLYVDYSSWLWYVAVDVARAILTGDTE
jgi:hypothetical protein